MVKFFKNVSNGLVSICLAGTLLAGTGCAKFYTEKPKIKADSLAVLVIDMQDFWLGEIDEKELETELPYQAEVLNYCDKNNIPVFVIEYKNCGPTTAYLSNKLKDIPKKEYITKTNRSAFERTNLEEKLKASGVDTLILMGVYASHCVKGTAEGALDAGFDIIISKDLIADKKNSDNHKPEENVEWYKKHGIYLNSYKQLLEIIEK